MSAEPSVADRPVPARPWGRLLLAREHDPFACLGPARDSQGWRIRVFRPGAAGVALETPVGIQSFDCADPTGVFVHRIMSELQGSEKYYLFTKPPFVPRHGARY